MNGLDTIELQEFPDRASASQAAAGWMAQALRAAHEQWSQASMVVSGGSTPVQCFEALSTEPLDWPNTRVYMSDERSVPPSHEASNEAMVRDKLLAARASQAELVPVYVAGATVQGQCDLLAKRLEQESHPFATVLLGMGEDGHFASLFPDFQRLSEGLALDSGLSCLSVSTKASPHPRITLTLPVLVNSKAVILLMFGKSKRAVLESAMRGEGDYPVQALLEQGRAPVRVAWAP